MSDKIRRNREVMSLLIVAAKDTNEALELLSTKPKKAIKTHFVEEFEGIDNFLYDFKDEFLHYEIYYRFDPYRETYLEASSVCKIKIFQVLYCNGLLRIVQKKTR